MKEFFEDSAMLNHPIRALKDFLEKDDALIKAKQYRERRFVGYVLETGYDTVTIITSDPFKEAVGGIPRNSLLVMLPTNYEKLPLHFTLLRVLEAAPTPLTHEVQQTYFELQKKSMPEIDVFTQSELQWGALRTSVLGMYYPCPDPDKFDRVEFSGDINNFVSAHKYSVFAPDSVLLDLIINSLVSKENRFSLGYLRLTESRMAMLNQTHPQVTSYVCTSDFMGNRTAMFGKTRLGKSNVVKLIAQSLIDTTHTSKNVGQLIFDINGEYANDNPQDDSSSLKSIYPTQCDVYALTPKANTKSKPLKLDFYDRPKASHGIIRALLREESKDTSNYISSFLSVDIPSIESLKELEYKDELRAHRKILMYWAILYRAGFKEDLQKLKHRLSIDPKFNKEVRTFIYDVKDVNLCPAIESLDDLAREFELCVTADRIEKLKSSSGKDLFDADDLAILWFLIPRSATSSGPKIIQNYRKFHDPKAGDFVFEIINNLNNGKTTILDLGNAPPEVTDYFSRYLSEAIFYEQVEKFSNNVLGNHYVQLYFEEAHNLFPSKEKDEIDIYRRIAKEGAKYHIGMVYSTQSPSTINRDLLAQTENFFVAHLSSQDEVDALIRVNAAYEGLKYDILQTRTVGYMRMLTRSHRFVIPIQAHKFTPLSAVKSSAGE